MYTLRALWKAYPHVKPRRLNNHACLCDARLGWYVTARKLSKKNPKEKVTESLLAYFTYTCMGAPLSCWVWWKLAHFSRSLTLSIMPILVAIDLCEGAFYAKGQVWTFPIGMRYGPYNIILCYRAGRWKEKRNDYEQLGTNLHSVASMQRCNFASKSGGTKLLLPFLSLLSFAVNEKKWGYAYTPPPPSVSLCFHESANKFMEIIWSRLWFIQDHLDCLFVH